MPTNLTGQTVASTYDQLLHVDDGPAATEKIVYSGTGVATALKVGTLSASVDNLQFDGNTIASTNTNGNIVLAPDGTGAVVLTNVDVTNGTATGLTSASATTVNGGNLRLTSNTLSSTDTNGNITLTPNGTGQVRSSAPLGYATGAGGTVTQATDKTTAVTLNKVSGQITMDNDSLGAGAGVSFTFTNSFIGATDVVLVSIASGATAAAYTLQVSAVAAGSCVLSLRNHTGGGLSEAVVINFVVVKGVNA